MTYVIHDTHVPICIYRFRPTLGLSDIGNKTPEKKPIWPIRTHELTGL
jgi:hypothetical protein